MSENRVDLKQLVIMIKENKDFEANLILDEGCVIFTDDPKPLVKVLNYIINYLNQISDKAIEIALDLRSNDHLLSLMVYTDKSDLPDFSSEVEGALKAYKGSIEKIHVSGKYIQFKLSFAH